MKPPGKSGGVGGGRKSKHRAAQSGSATAEGVKLDHSQDSAPPERPNKKRASAPQAGQIGVLQPDLTSAEQSHEVALNAMRDELARVLASVAELSRRAEQGDAQLADLRQSTDRSKIGLSKSEASLARQRALAAELKKSAELANRRLADLKLAAEELSAALSDREGRLADLARTNGVLRADLARVNALLASQTDLNADLQRELSETKVRHLQSIERECALEVSNRIGRTEISDARDRAAKAEPGLTELTSQITALEHVIQTLERYLKAVLESRSWRLTAPWRAYKRMISRMSRVWLRAQKDNPLFDREWYLQKYLDVDFGEIDPFDHYLRYGAAEWRNPNSLFDTKWYLEQNADVRESGINPLSHFYRHGAAEGRDPHPLFTMNWHDRWSSSADGRDTNAIIKYLRVLRKNGR
jgi:hypothetical protein